MTITIQYPDGSTMEYAAVVVRAGNSPKYRLKAPDNSTVETYSGRPSSITAENDLLDAGYDIPAGSKIPYRDMEIPAESLPGDLTVSQ